MARSGSGSNYAFGGTAPGGTFNNFSFHAVIRGNANAGTSADHKAISLREASGAGTAIDMGFHWDHTNSSFAQAVFWRNSTGSYFSAKLTTSLLANTDYRIGCTFDGSNLRAWLNGTNEATTGVSGSLSGATCKAAILATAFGQDIFSGGVVSELGLWNVALTTDEMGSLSKGFSPNLVRPSQLLAYLPFIQNDIDFRNSPAWADSGTPVWTDHPRIY